MPVILSFRDVDVFLALRKFLLSILPSGIEVIRAQTNRVPEPAQPDFVVMTEILRTRLETNTNTYGNASGVPTTTILQPTQFDIQLDIHGPTSGGNAQIISTLARSPVGTEFFDNQTLDAQLLYASDPRQTPFMNAENQWETRWIVELSLQANMTVTLS